MGLIGWNSVFSWGNPKLSFTGYNFQRNTDSAQVVEIIRHGRQGHVILYHRYHACWCLGDSRDQGLCRHGSYLFLQLQCVNTLRPRQNGRHFPDDISKCIFLNENVWISIKISLKFVPKGPINILGFVQIMAWRRPGDKPLSEPKMFSLLVHLCGTRP